MMVNVSFGCIQFSWLEIEVYRPIVLTFKPLFFMSRYFYDKFHCVSFNIQHSTFIIQNCGLPPYEVRKIEKLIFDNKNILMEKYNEYHKS